MSIDEVAAAARQAGLPDPAEIRPPAHPGTAWTVATVERQWPIQQTTVAIHPISGEIVDRVDWDEYPLLAKATTLGIQFHQAELFGLAQSDIP